MTSLLVTKPNNYKVNNHKRDQFDQASKQGRETIFSM